MNGNDDVNTMTAGDAPPAGPGTAVDENDVRDALRGVIDPEIGLDVVTLGLIRAVQFDPDETLVTMILTTPFCPYGGAMIQAVKTTTESVVGGVVRVELGEELWSPDMMEGGDWAEWGLV